MPWIFAIFWTSLSAIFFLRVLQQTPIQWGGVGLAMPFLLIGLGLIAWLLRRILHRRRLGPAQLVLTPSPAAPGERVTFRLQLERGDLGHRQVQFRLELQEPDDESGWNTLETVEQTAELMAAVPMAQASLIIPSTAAFSSSRLGARRRWLASARVQGLHLAPVECQLDVRRVERPDEPSSQLRALSDAPTGAKNQSGAISGTLAPPGARETAPGVWAWQESSRMFQTVGLVLLAFAAVWLGFTARSALPELRALALGTDMSLITLGALLFRLPFWVAGTVVALLGLALLTFQHRALVRRGELVVSLHALGRRWLEEATPLAKISYLQTTGSLRSNEKILRYGLAAKTSAGRVSVPITAKSAAALTPHARWLAQVLGAPDLGFDPQVVAPAMDLAHTQPHSPAPAQLLKLLQVGRLLRQLIVAATALGLLGFALLIFATLLAR
jgi:hypothetical protein